MAWRHQECSCPWQSWRQCPWHSPRLEPRSKEQERLQCLFLKFRPAPKGHQQQHSYSQAGQRGASLLYGTRQGACQPRDLAKTVLESYQEFTRSLPERNRHLNLEKHTVRDQPETPNIFQYFPNIQFKLDCIFGKISSGKELQSIGTGCSEKQLSHHPQMYLKMRRCGTLGHVLMVDLAVLF